MDKAVNFLKIGIVLLLLIGVALVAIPRFLLNGQKPEVELVGDLEDKPVTAEVPFSYPIVRKRLEAVFNPDPTVVGTDVPNRFGRESKWSAFHLVSNEDGQGIDALYQGLNQEMNQASPSQEITLSLGFRQPDRVDSALEPYLSQPAARRQLDLLLMITPFQSPEFWWTSLYNHNGNAVPYRTHYILSLTPVSGSSTKIEIIAVDSEVEAGEEYSYGNGVGSKLFPSKMPARMLVKPVVKDKFETLEAIIGALSPPESGNNKK